MGIDIEKAIRMCADTGKVEFGTRTCKYLAAHGAAKLILLAGNCPSKIRNEIIEICKNSKVPYKEVSYPSIELGSLAGKPFPVLMMAVIEPGDSEILKIIE
ncbi:MAG: 50S ribosomal protein L30e [Candidatus Micrarchaeota archaeon]|nr:50S ribosomal protein L30e [Candidatus Micrarchaeota archaeon]